MLQRRLLQRRLRLNLPLLTQHFAGAALATAGAALALTWRGPLPVATSEWSAPHVPTYTYMLLAFPLFGAICADLLAGLLARRPGARRLLLQTALLCAFAGARLGWRIPLSGHVMLGVFFVAWAWRLPHRPTAHLETTLGALVLAWFLWVKLALWGDLVTPTLGALTGLAIAALPRYCGEMKQ